eukprot:Transcript_26464.p3 GENE.Transcript_26464~~Transcript_26464.p3  ORF type:complete len:125 (+),score=42.61 Transcript_26464:604-978(+)
MTMTGNVNIRYDDGDSWTGSATEVWLLDHNHPPKNLWRYAWELAIVKVKSTFSVPPMCVIFVILLLLFLTLPSLADMRTGETALWYSLQSCLTATSPAFVYSLRAPEAPDAVSSLEGFACPTLR